MKQQIIMLPAKEKSLNATPIVLCDDTLYSCYSAMYSFEKASFQHIYAISNEQINKNDYYYNEHTKEVYKRISDANTSPYESGFHKVVKSTNKKLNLPEFTEGEIDAFIKHFNNL